MKKMRKRKPIAMSMVMAMAKRLALLMNALRREAARQERVAVKCPKKEGYHYLDLP